MNTRWTLLPVVALGLCTSALSAAPKPAVKPTKPVASKPAAKPVAKPNPQTKPLSQPVEPKAQPVVAPEAAPSFQTWALLVGVSKYQAPIITSLNYPAADASGIRDALTDPKLGGVPANNIKLLTNEDATAANITGAVDNFLKPNVKPGDHVVIFLAGHGVAKGVGTNAKSYLLPTDVRGLSTAALDASAIDLKAFSNKLAQLPAAQFVQFIDACREDPTPGRAGKQNALSDVLSRGVQIVPQDETKASSVTFFACGVGQRAFEDPKFKHGVFTYWILEGIRAAAVPQAPDGAVDMGRLSTYVSNQVGEWTKQASQNGDFELEQTPEMIASEPGSETASVVLMRVKRPLSSTPLPAASPKLTLITFPEGAQIFINGQKAGAAPLVRDLAAGTHQVRVEAPGYEPREKSVRLIDGYQQQVVFELKPQSRGVAPADEATNALFQRAVDAESRQLWEVAEAGYKAVIGADGKFAPAYERLADLQSREGRYTDALNTTLTMGLQTPANAHSYSLVANAFTLVALKGAGDENTDTRRLTVGPFKTSAVPAEAAAMAKRAADLAIKADAKSGEANRALGFALIATDVKGATSSDALAALGNAVFLDEKDAANHYAYGYAIRFYAQFKTGALRENELKRAVETLKQAVALRPNYYDAHRELAYCHHLLGNTDAAMRSYELADANRGAARDRNEVAGNNVALASLHEERAKTSTGAQKQRDQEASAAYMEEAKETSKDDLSKAVSVLGMIGLGTRIRDYLPADMRRVLDLPNNIEGEIRGKVNNEVARKVPGKFNPSNILGF
ncbi:MAG TPA: caspase family protein [Abditibacteriaceae bacterium]|jgi:tetratricopeptide (TPR) repeat protein